MISSTCTHSKLFQSIRTHLFVLSKFIDPRSNLFVNPGSPNFGNGFLVANPSIFGFFIGRSRDEDLFFHSGQHAITIIIHRSRSRSNWLCRWWSLLLLLCCCWWWRSDRVRILILLLLLRRRIGLLRLLLRLLWIIRLLLLLLLLRRVSSRRLLLLWLWRRHGPLLLLLVGWWRWLCHGFCF